MKKLPFREHHLVQLMEGYSAQPLPLDLYISRYFRAHKALGSKDRGFIAETVYGMVRWQRLIDHLIEGAPDWEKRLAFYARFAAIETAALPPSLRTSFPEELFSLLEKSFGGERAEKIALASNRPAPTTVRANRLKTTREALLARLAARFEVSPSPFSELGIIFHKKLNFFTLPEFKEGLFEVQDEGSQLLAALVGAAPGELVMDYCAGSGGKSLAIAAEMENRGQIYLHDIRKRALYEARKRLKRAGVQNAQLLFPDDPKMKRLKKKIDRVLVDAPCSGTGTLRRNPDMKGKFSCEMLKRLVGEQRKIFERALSFLKPGGRIVYATCSLLDEENGRQVAHFLKNYPLELEGAPFQSVPEDGGMDGFFGAVFKTSSHV